MYSALSTSPANNKAVSLARSHAARVRHAAGSTRHLADTSSCVRVVLLLSSVRSAHLSRRLKLLSRDPRSPAAQRYEPLVRAALAELGGPTSPVRPPPPPYAARRHLPSV